MAAVTMKELVLHGGKRYLKDEEYELDDELAYYFVVNGWASSDDTVEGVWGASRLRRMLEQTGPSETTLEPHDIDRAAE